LHRYMNADFEKLANHLLVEANPAPGLFKDSELKQVLATGLHQKTDSASKSVFRSSHQLWMLMQLFGWMQRFNIEPTDG